LPSIFINYRTSESLPTATLLDRELSGRFGSDEVFRAGRSIAAGTRFPEEISRALRKCDVMLSLIGPGWRDARTDDGRRALDDATDWVRREIVDAFEYGLLVIPVYLDRTSRLERDDLPEPLAELAELQSLTLQHRYPEDGFDRITEAIVRRVPALAEKWSARRGHGDRPAVPESTFRGNLFLGTTTVDGDVVGGDKHVWGAGGSHG
jgi:hypothetical protein